MERPREWGKDRQRVIELVNSGLSIARAAPLASYSEGGARKVVRAARERGIEVRACAPGRPLVDRDQVIRQFEKAINKGRLPTEAVRSAADRAGCSETTVYRARRGK